MKTKTKIANQNFIKAIAAKKWLVVVFLFLKVSGFGQDTVYLLGYNKIYYFDVNTCKVMDSVVVNYLNFSSIGINKDGNIYGCSVNPSTIKVDSIFMLNPVTKVITPKCINLSFGYYADFGACFDEQGNMFFLNNSNVTNTVHVIKYNVNNCSIITDYDLGATIGVDGDLVYINGMLYVTYDCKIWQIDLNGDKVPKLVYNSTYPCDRTQYVGGYLGLVYTCYQNRLTFVVSNYENSDNKLYSYDPISGVRALICNLNFTVFDAACKLPEINYLNLGKDTSLCSFTNFKLITNIPTTQWSNGQTGSSIIITQPGKYWASVTNSCGTYTDTINIFQNLIVKHDTSFTICQNDTLMYNHKKYYAQGVFFDTIHSIVGCDSVQKVKISNNKSYDSTLVESVCKGAVAHGFAIQKDTIITVKLQTTKACDSILHYAVKVKFSSSAIQQINVCRNSNYQGVFISKDTVLTKVFANSVNCDSTVTYTIIVSDSVVVQKDTSLCISESIFNQYYTSDTIVKFYNQSVANCDSITVYKITVHPVPTVTIKDTIISDDSLQLTASGALSYQWSSSLVSNQITVSTYINQQYIVIGTDSNKCKAKDTFTVQAKNTDIYIPSAFSPNNDGINDELTVFITNPISYHLEIYNRWNQLLFVSDAIQNKWNGKYKGEEVPVDGYLYILKVTTANGKQIQKQGIITLLR